MNKEIQQSYFRAALQAGAARQWAEMKRNRHFKREKVEKQSYKPGTLGLSAVSEAIKEKYGRIVSRRERRSYKANQAKVYRAGSTFDVRRELKFTAFYSGESPIRVPHNIKPSKWA